jgi:RNA polymerase sigma factor (TIGR02999 family)
LQTGERFNAGIEDMDPAEHAPAAAAPSPAADATAGDAVVVLTRLLNDAGSGDPSAAATLLPYVYEELRRLARSRMRRERADQTLSATALVHEAYVRLVDQTRPPAWQGRWQFFAAAAEAMRRILVDNARRRARLKHGGGRQRVDLDDVHVLTVQQPPDQLLALDEALEELTRLRPEKARLVKLRYFAGLTNQEAADAMQISLATAERHWAYARAWLYRRMARGDG